MTTVIWDGRMVVADTHATAYQDGVALDTPVVFNSLYMPKNMSFEGDEVQCIAATGCEYILNRFIRLMENRVPHSILMNIDSYATEIAETKKYMPELGMGIGGHVLLICKKCLFYVKFCNTLVAYPYLMVQKYDRNIRIAFGDAMNDLGGERPLSILPAPCIISDLIEKSEHAGGDIRYWKLGMSTAGTLYAKGLTVRFYRKVSAALRWLFKIE